MVLLQTSRTLTKVLCVLGAPSSRPVIFLHKLIEYDMENLIPSKDTLANEEVTEIYLPGEPGWWHYLSTFLKKYV